MTTTTPAQAPGLAVLEALLRCAAAAAMAPDALGKGAAPVVAKAPAPGEIESHGLSTFGDLAEPADFKHFGYVNPAAPKGGTLALLPGPLPLLVRG